MAVALAARAPIVEERSVQRFGRDAHEIRAAREFVAYRLRLRRAPDDVVDAFRLAVSELGANAVAHGDHTGWTVGVGASPEAWTMTVVGGCADSSNPMLHPEEWAMVAPSRAHGRGLAIVAGLMHAIAVDVVVRRVRVRCSIRR